MRLTALLAIVLATAACSGGSSGATSAGSGTSAPVATVLPASGTVKLSDGITYTVAAPGTTLRLDNLTLRIMGLRWEKHVPVTVTPPGTRIFAVFTRRDRQQQRPGRDRAARRRCGCAPRSTTPTWPPPAPTRRAR